MRMVRTHRGSSAHLENGESMTTETNRTLTTDSQTVCSPVRDLAESAAEMLVQLGETAKGELGKLGAEIKRLRAENKRMREALEEIEDRAQDNYDGPEDRTHGPYLSFARQGLGIWP